MTKRVRGTWRHLARAGRRGGFATHLLLRVAVRVSGNTDASVVPILAVRGLRRPPLLALHLEARGTEDSRTVGRASYCGARRRTRAEKSPRKRALLKDNPRVKESEATRASLRDVELCDEEAKDPSPTQKWRVKNAFEESRSVRASLSRDRPRSYTRVGPLGASRFFVYRSGLRTKSMSGTAHTARRAVAG